VNERQRIAITDPCGRAVDTLRRHFWRIEKAPIRRLLVQSGLTVNR
jgi:hypothetical protein